jgi:hypothetical protein
MDISTPEGMAAAIAWTERQVALVAQGGLWGIPRSGTAIRIDHENKTATFYGSRSVEPDVIKVFRAMGWSCKGAMVEALDAYEAMTPDQRKEFIEKGAKE